MQVSILLLLARFLLGLKNGVRAAHKAKEFRKGVGGSGTVCLS